MKIGAWDFVKEDRKHLYGGLCRVQVFFLFVFGLRKTKSPGGSGGPSCRRDDRTAAF